MLINQWNRHKLCFVFLLVLHRAHPWWKRYKATKWTVWLDTFTVFSLWHQTLHYWHSEHMNGLAESGGHAWVQAKSWGAAGSVTKGPTCPMTCHITQKLVALHDVRRNSQGNSIEMMLALQPWEKASSCIMQLHNDHWIRPHPCGENTCTGNFVQDEEQSQFSPL